jgi:uncharacterized protein (DUF58 family)
MKMPPAALAASLASASAATVAGVGTGEGVVSVSLPSLLALRHCGEALTLKPKRVRAASSGSYLSPFKGRGMEFDEVRPYSHGDDARLLDWRVTARTGRPHTKLFREERERAVLLWLDLRPAMFFATRGAFKAVRAAQAAALLGWCAVHQGDRLGGLIFSDTEHIELRPKRGKAALLHLLRSIGAHTRAPAASTAPTPTSNVNDRHQSINQALLRLRQVAQPGSLLVLLSDFAQLDAHGEAQLAQLARHNELLLLDIHDPLEAELPPPGNYRVGDGQRFLTLATADAGLRTRYRERFAAQQAHLRQFCQRHHMTLLPLGTGEQPQEVLQRFLGVRP